jgi:hypothetical protein
MWMILVTMPMVYICLQLKDALPQMTMQEIQMLTLQQMKEQVRIVGLGPPVQPLPPPPQPNYSHPFELTVNLHAFTVALHPTCVRTMLLHVTTCLRIWVSDGRIRKIYACYTPDQSINQPTNFASVLTELTILSFQALNLKPEQLKQMSLEQKRQMLDIYESVRFSCFSSKLLS